MSTHTPVPVALRPWTAPHPAYAPVDITPPELRSPERAGAEHWVVDTATDAAAIRDILAARRTMALFAWQTDADGRPLNPAGRTGKCGRDLGRWGENAAADPIVTTGTGDHRQILLIKREDTGQWAIPGGHVDDGETATDAATRELLEEASIDVTGQTPHILTRTLVEDDPRTSDYAWIATVAVTYHLPAAIAPTAGDDATDAAWWPAADLDTLTAALTATGQQLYPAHHDLLTLALGQGRSIDGTTF